MGDEVIIATDTAETEAATQNAELSAQGANEAAVAATAAAAAQSQLINDVTAAAREDSQLAAAKAESAASESKQYAELSQLAIQTALDEMRSMMSDYGSRLDMMEQKHNQPVVVNNDQDVSPIDPESIEGNARNESMEGEGKKESKSSRRSHGRTRR